MRYKINSIFDFKPNLRMKNRKIKNKQILNFIYLMHIFFRINKLLEFIFKQRYTQIYIYIYKMERRYRVLWSYFHFFSFCFLQNKYKTVDISCFFFIFWNDEERIPSEITGGWLLGGMYFV